MSLNRQCAVCLPGVRCAACRDRSRAHGRMYRLARLHVSDRHRLPVEYADQVTSMHDARAALCLAMGFGVAEIDPCTGHGPSGVRVARQEAAA